MHSEAYIDGWLAHKNDVEVDANPYDEKSAEASNFRWTNGWCSRFRCIKHGGDAPEARLCCVESEDADITNEYFP